MDRPRGARGVLWARLGRAIAAAAWLLGAGACGGSGQAASRPNLLVVMVDTTRADHVGYHGYGRETTPNVDALAAESVVFLNHYSHASRTGPSVASLFTGLHPKSHGVVNPLTGWDAKGSLHPDRLTLAEILQERGYTCHGLVANINASDRFGFDQGFASYELVRPKNARSVNERAIALLEEISEPFFLYLHYIDPHSSYGVEESHAGLWVDPDYGGVATGQHSQLDQIVAGRLRLSEADVRHLRDLYDQDLRFFDDSFGALLAYLEERGLREDTLIVFLADHGEEFLDHGSVLHGYTLYEEQLRVPLFIHDPRRPAHERSHRVQAITRHVDLLPTLLELFDLRPVPGLQGRSLVPLMEGAADWEPAPVYAQASLRAVRTIRKESLLQDGWKLIRTTIPAEREELYHVDADPAEAHDLAAERPDVLARMRRALRAYEEALPAGEGGALELSEEDYAELRHLGYVR